MKYSNDKSVVFNNESHTYIRNKKQLTSVTTFIDNFKNNEKLNIYERIMVACPAIII